jgi:hypothetical protein
MNNGFYLFDSLAPGQYKVYFEAEDYKIDSSIVTVQPNKTVFADKYMELVPNLNVPTVVSTNPADGAQSVSLREHFEIEFDIRMNRQKVQAAFTTNPPLQGSFTWSNNNKRFKFEPNNMMLPGTEYTAIVSSNAESHFGVQLGSDYSFRILTRSKLNLLGSYPLPGDDDLSTTVRIEIRFDAPIDPFSLPGNIGLYDDNGNTVPVSVNTQAYEEGAIIFEPQQPLDPHSFYRIELREGIGDVEDLSFGENVTINFLTEKEVYVSGNIIDDFEILSGWLDPASNQNSMGIDPEVTLFELSNRRNISGNKSGRLLYSFTDVNGVCFLEKGTNHNLGSDSESNFGMWIFGDNSGNLIEYHLSDNQNNIASVVVDTINWTGWKIKYLKLGDTGLNNGYLFGAVSVNRSAQGRLTGEIFIDDMQADVITPVGKSEDNLPITFGLSQNYPNPFNPSTIISFRIPKDGTVNLKVFDILGQEVARLIDDRFMKKGEHRIEFNTVTTGVSPVASGVYFYELTSGEYSDIRKMLLLK